MNGASLSELQNLGTVGILMGFSVLWKAWIKLEVRDNQLWMAGMVHTTSWSVLQDLGTLWIKLWILMGIRVLWKAWIKLELRDNQFWMT